jgi:hypothetical protein
MSRPCKKRIKQASNLGPVWIRGIYAKIVFSPKYIFAKVGVVWIRGIFGDITARGKCGNTAGVISPQIVDSFRSKICFGENPIFA